MTLDARARATAFKMLAKFGKTSELVRAAGDPVYDPLTGVWSGNSERYPIKMLAVKPGKSELEGGQMVATDQVVIFPAKGLPVTPVATDAIVFDDKNPIVITVAAIWSGEQVALWRCIIRG